jgi:ribosome-binding ATPase
MKIGIVWLPNVGKSTLFNALTKSYAADAGNFPFCTIEPNVGIVDVKDVRLEILSKISNTQKIVYATTSFVDIAGLVKWASSGEWLGNKFLSHIREVDVIVQVLRYFQNPDVSHVEWSVDPLRDVEIINMELIISDLEQVDKNLPAIAKKASVTKEKTMVATASALTKIKKALDSGKLIYDIRDELTVDEHHAIKNYNFLTDKSFLYAINVWQDDLPCTQEIQQEFYNKLQKPIAIVCAALESEMITLSESEREEFLEMMVDKVDVKTIPTLDDMISLAFKELWLMYYFTTGEKESRAWTVLTGSTAPQAAAAIHSDFERGFIKAEIVNYQHFVDCGSRSKAKEKWLLKLQWKDYIVQDWDIIVFKFNV